MSGSEADDLRRQRDNVSVLKVELARLRERDRCRIVVVLEGKDDLPIYENWINRIDPDYTWEPLVAKGKKKVLEFREMLKNDTTGMSICTYFIVDHDYDGLRGYSAAEDIFVFPAYSVENLLVEERVLESYLRTELRVISDPDERQRILSVYSDARRSFCDIVRPSCALLYGARNEQVGNIKVGKVGDVVFLEDGALVVRPGRWLDSLVVTDQAVSASGVCIGEEFLQERGDHGWIRGKFLLDFFKNFCEIVYLDRVSDRPVLFSGAVADKSLSGAGLDIRNLASKCSIPEGFAETIRRWAEECSDSCAQEPA